MQRKLLNSMLLSRIKARGSRYSNQENNICILDICYHRKCINTNQADPASQAR